MEWKHVQKKVTVIKQNFALRKLQKMIFCYFQENRSQSNDFYNWIQTFGLKVKFMSTKINVKIYNLISSLICVLYRMEKCSVRTFDKYSFSQWRCVRPRDGTLSYLGASVKLRHQNLLKLSIICFEISRKKYKIINFIKKVLFPKLKHCYSTWVNRHDRGSGT